jgi:hypothetical protein
MRRAALAVVLLTLLLPAAGADGQPTPQRTVAFVPSGFVAAAGDLACVSDRFRGAKECHADATGYLIRKVNGPFDPGGVRPNAILPLGDMQYPAGNLDQFTYRNRGCQTRPPFLTGDGLACSFDDSWGRSVTTTGSPIRPVTGNHEYESSDVSAKCDRLLSLDSHTACGMERNFGDPIVAPWGAGTPSVGGTVYGDGRGDYYYMFNTSPTPMLFVALNTGACTVSAANEALCDGTNQDAAPIRFLRKTLSNSAVNPPGACVAVYYHQPRWSRYDYPTLGYMRGVWKELFDAAIPRSQRADLVLNGHAHNYQRFAPVDAQGVASPTTGIREIITGTGGNDLDTDPPACPIGERCIAPMVYDLEDFGAGKLEWDANAAMLRYSFYAIHDDGTTALIDRSAWNCRT